MKILSKTLLCTVMLFCWLMLILTCCAFPKKQPEPLIFNATIPRPIVIAIIDTGYNFELAKKAPHQLKLCPTGHYDFNTSTPTIGHTLNHGTYVASILANELYNVNYCAIIYQMLAPNKARHADMLLAYQWALNAKVDYVNYSWSGLEMIPGEKAALMALRNAGIKVVTSAGNNNLDLNDKCVSYPVCYNLDSIISVGVLNTDYSNYGPHIAHWASGELELKGMKTTDHGTSFATPRVLAQDILSNGNIINKYTNDPITPKEGTNEVSTSTSPTASKYRLCASQVK